MPKTHPGKLASGRPDPIPHPSPLPHCHPEDGQRIPLLMRTVGTLGLSLLSASPTLSPGRRQESPFAQGLLLRLKCSLQSQHDNLTA